MCGGVSLEPPLIPRKTLKLPLSSPAAMQRVTMARPDRHTKSVLKSEAEVNGDKLESESESLSLLKLQLQLELEPELEQELERCAVYQLHTIQGR